MSAEARYWERHPAVELLARTGGDAPLTASGLRLTRTYGCCMWPGVREGDLVFYAPLPDGRLEGLIGQIGIARAERGPIAHRILRVFGGPGNERLVLGGDLAEADPPRRREDVLGLVKAVYRPGQGFVDLPPRLEIGPFGAAILSEIGRFFTWAARVASS